MALERLGTSTTVEKVRQLDEEGRLARNLVDPPSKDTVTVPDGGYTVLRVHADNPGTYVDKGRKEWGSRALRVG